MNATGRLLGALALLTVVAAAGDTAAVRAFSGGTDVHRASTPP